MRQGPVKRTPPDDDAARQAESAAILRRVRQETDPQIGAHAGRLLGGAGRHFGGADADPADRMDVWGTRIGRGLGLLAFVGLLALLARQLGG